MTFDGSVAFGCGGDGEGEAAVDGSGSVGTCVSEMYSIFTRKETYSVNTGPVTVMKAAKIWEVPSAGFTTVPGVRRVISVPAVIFFGFEGAEARVGKAW